MSAVVSSGSFEDGRSLLRTGRAEPTCYVDHRHFKENGRILGTIISSDQNNRDLRLIQDNFISLTGSSKRPFPVLDARISSLKRFLETFTMHLCLKSHNIALNLTTHNGESISRILVHSPHHGDAWLC